MQLFYIVQIAAQGILKYCLHGFLAKQQQETLFFFLDTTAKLLQETHLEEDLDKLETDMNVSLALLERDYPMSTQVGKFVRAQFKQLKY